MSSSESVLEDDSSSSSRCVTVASSLLEASRSRLSGAECSADLCVWCVYVCVSCGVVWCDVMLCYKDVFRKECRGEGSREINLGECVDDMRI